MLIRYILRKPECTVIALRNRKFLFTDRVIFYRQYDFEISACANRALGIMNNRIHAIKCRKVN